MEYASITAWGTLPHPLDKHLWVDLELPKKVFMFGNKSKAPVKHLAGQRCLCYDDPEAHCCRSALPAT